jgi:hypothetical protein
MHMDPNRAMRVLLGSPMEFFFETKDCEAKSPTSFYYIKKHRTKVQDIYN